MRQGCPLSALLYTLLAETLGEEIRKNKNLHGITLPGNKEQKITQYADNTTIYLSEKSQLKYLFQILKCFQSATGSKVNEYKTKGLKLRVSTRVNECHHKVKCKNDEGLEILGVRFFPDNLHTSNCNWSERMGELHDFVETNKTRKLSLRGKVLLLNAKGMAKFWYLATVIPMPK